MTHPGHFTLCRPKNPYSDTLANSEDQDEIRAALFAKTESIRKGRRTYNSVMENMACDPLILTMDPLNFIVYSFKEKIHWSLKGLYSKT